MRLALDPRAARLLRRLPRSFPYAVVEIALLVLIAIQAARLIWVAVAPVGPFGEWKAARSGALVADAGLLTRFDPFFRLAAQPGAAVVTSLQLKLFGTRMNNASGGGSAIIAGPDGIQNSYAVGDEIVPGVKLKSVAFDNVTIDRGGTAEQLFLDQSVAAPVAGGATPVVTPGAPPPSMAAPAPITATSLQNGVNFAPRTQNGAVSGFTVSAKGDGAAFRAIGLQPGDVVTAINGQTIQSVEAAGAALARPSASGMATFNVERGGQVVTLQASIAR